MFQNVIPERVTIRSRERTTISAHAPDSRAKHGGGEDEEEE
jgi:hypothetical protein